MLNHVASELLLLRKLNLDFHNSGQMWYRYMLNHVAFEFWLPRKLDSDYHKMWYILTLRLNNNNNNNNNNNISYMPASSIGDSNKSEPNETCPSDPTKQAACRTVDTKNHQNLVAAIPLYLK